MPRSRFLPVKGTSDLLLVQSDLYSLTHGQLIMNPQRPFPTVPLIKLGKEFSKVGDYLSRFSSIPTILELDHLTITGDVTIGSGVTFKVPRRPGEPPPPTGVRRVRTTRPPANTTRAMPASLGPRRSPCRAPSSLWRTTAPGSISPPDPSWRTRSCPATCGSWTTRNDAAHPSIPPSTPLCVVQSARQDELRNVSFDEFPIPQPPGACHK